MGKIRSKKLISKVDLTAMVGVVFLLIAFFMITQELAKPHKINLFLPTHGTCGPITCGPDENSVLTLLLGENDRIVIYPGILNYPLSAPKEVQYGNEGIRKELMKRNKLVQDYYTSIGRNARNGMIVIIKPSKKSNYGNLVDILDELSIAGIDNYSIVNTFTPEEIKLIGIK